MRQLLSVLIHPCMLFNLDKYENQTAKGKNMQVISTFDNPGSAAAAAPVPTQGPNFVANA